MRIVFTNGVFDLLHVGHVALLYQARALGDVLIVGINSDDSTRRLKGLGRPIMPAKERAKIVGSIAPVSKTMIFQGSTPIDLIQDLRPAVLVKGGDYLPEEVVGREFVESYGGKVEIIPLQADVSTTSIVSRIRDGRAWEGPFPEGEPWYGFDLDGTLAYYESGYAGKGKIGPPIAPVVDLVKKLLSEGKRVAIVTARVSDPRISSQVRALVRSWTAEHIGVALPVTCRKDYGLVTLYDDRSIGVVHNEGIFVLPEDDWLKGDS